MSIFIVSWYPGYLSKLPLSICYRPTCHCIIWRIVVEFLVFVCSTLTICTCLTVIITNHPSPYTSTNMLKRQIYKLIPGVCTTVRQIINLKTMKIQYLCVNTQKKMFSVSSLNPTELQKGTRPLRRVSGTKLRRYMVRSKINNILTAVLIFSFQMFPIVYSKLCIFISALVELMMQLLICSHWCNQSTVTPMTGNANDKFILMQCMHPRYG